MYPGSSSSECSRSARSLSPSPSPSLPSDNSTTRLSPVSPLSPHWLVGLLTNPHPAASGHPEQSLDPSDFPALGSVGAGGFQHQHHPQAQPQPAQLAQQQQQQQPLSSYASQAGTLPQAPPQPQPVTAPGSNSINSNSTPNLAPPQLPPPQHQTPNSIPQSLSQSAAAALAGRDFTPDDFPALGGFNSDVGGHPNGQQNGNLLGGGGAGPRAGGVGGSGGIGTQEQASAVAALQHQQNRHRANLLGSMNGSPAMGAAGPPPRGGAYPPEADKSVRLHSHSRSCSRWS